MDIKQHATTVFNGYSEIFFLHNPGIGLVIVAITLIHPNIALCGIISVVAAHLFARLIGVDRNLLQLGFYTYNPLLVGLSIGYLFKLTPSTILLVITGGVLTFVVTIAMVHFFSTYLKLPVLSFPFVIVSTMIYLASIKYVNLPVSIPSMSDPLAQYLPLWLCGYFQSLGAVFFMPQIALGVVLMLSILATSRILFLLSVAGYYTGVVFTALMIGSFTQAFADVSHFNSILVAMAVGGIFLIPSLKNYLLALIAVCVSAVFLHSVQIFWSYSRIPGFTLAFNVVSLGFIYVLGLIHYPHLTRLAKSTPEETLDVHLMNRYRYKGTGKTIMLPFSGKWTVWQGINGQWTHQGLWKYAYDFVITDEKGNSYRNGGSLLSDYYAYRKPVLSPVRGRVVKVITDLPDNPIGQPDTINNWGNLIIIHDERGSFVEISHFAQASIQVREGTWIEHGTLLGLCGNSGYSNQPHIHIQVQDTATIGAYTVPFNFSNYSNDHQFHANELPPEGTVVEALYWNTRIDRMTSFYLNTVYQYEVFKNGSRIGDLKLTVKMTPQGIWYLDSGRGKLYFGKHDGAFHFYSMEGHDPYLKMMLLALPRFPLACREGLQWSENLPIGMITKGFRRAAVQLISSFSHDFASVQVDLMCTRKNRIEGTIHSPTLKLRQKTLVEWDEQVGFTSFKIANLELRKTGNNLKTD